MTDKLPSFLLPNHKFAFLALDGWADDSVPSYLDLGSGMHLTRGLPLTVPEHWKEWLGTIAWDQLHNSGPLLWVVRPSQTPDLIDQENASLKNEVFMAYYGLMLSTRRLVTRSRGALVSGARKERADVRQHGWIPAVLANAGVPWVEVSRAEIEEAVRLGRTLGGIQNQPPFRRLRMALRCLRAGLEAVDPPERIHEFVRAVEGCILPAPGKTKAQFLSRTELFIGPREHAWTRDLFAVRSAVEHLNERLESLALPTQEEGILRMLRLAHEAQALARYCLHRVFSNEGLLEHFRDESTLAAFWQLAPDVRAQLWGPHLDLAGVRAEFDPALVERE